MGRLIDADVLIEAINEQVKGWGKSGIIPSLFSSIAIVQNQPTAYDVEAVVAEMEKHTRIMMPVIPAKEAIDIVRKGGVE